MWHPSSMLSNSWSLCLEIQLWNTASQQQGWMLDSTPLGPLNIQLVLGQSHIFQTLHRDRGGPDVRLRAGRPLGSLFMIRGASLLLGTIWLQESVWFRVEPWHLPHLLGSVLGWGNRVWQTQLVLGNSTCLPTFLRPPAVRGGPVAGSVQWASGQVCWCLWDWGKRCQFTFTDLLSRLGSTGQAMQLRGGTACPTCTTLHLSKK